MEKLQKLLLMIRPIYSILFLIIFVFSCKGTNAQNVNINGKFICKTDSLVLEYCDYTTYSLCSDGYEQPFRLAPVLIKYKCNKDSFFNAYFDTVYMFYTHLESYKIKYDKVFAEDYIDSIYAHTSDQAKIVRTPNKFYNKSVRQYLHRNHIRHKSFDGFEYILLPDMKFCGIYAGKRSLIIPDNSGKSKGGTISIIEANLVYIVPD